MCGGDCDAAIAKAAAAVTHVQSQNQEVGFRNEGLGLFGLFSFDLSSAETNFWWLPPVNASRRVSESLIPNGASFKSLKFVEFWQSANHNDIGTRRLSVVLYVIYKSY